MMKSNLILWLVLAALLVIQTLSNAEPPLHKAEVLALLNDDPESQREKYSSLYFIPSSVNESVIDKLEGMAKALIDTSGYPGLVFLYKRNPPINPTEYDLQATEKWRVPVILVHDGVKWQIIETPFEGSRWEYAARSTDGKRVYAILDNNVEAPGWEVPLLISEDGGWTWHELTRIRKPFYMAHLRDFSMDFDGSGTVTFKFFDLSGITGNNARILFTARTEDGGRTWSKYEARWDAIRDGGMIRTGWQRPRETTQTRLKELEDSFKADLKRNKRSSAYPPQKSYIDLLLGEIANGFNVDSEFSSTHSGSRGSRTLLHLAIQNGGGNVELVQFLLDKGADPTILHRNTTPLEFARKSNNQAIVEVLETILTKKK